MTNQRRSGWVLLATLALLGSGSKSAQASRPALHPALPATSLRAGPVPAAWSNTRTGVRGIASPRRESTPAPSPTAQRTRTSLPTAVVGRRDDESGRRTPESRFTSLAVRAGPRLAGRHPVAVGDLHAAASIAIFHDAHAPPVPAT